MVGLETTEAPGPPFGPRPDPRAGTGGDHIHIIYNIYNIHINLIKYGFFVDHAHSGAEIGLCRCQWNEAMFPNENSTLPTPTPLTQVPPYVLVRVKHFNTTPLLTPTRYSCPLASKTMVFAIERSTSDSL